MWTQLVVKLETSQVENLINQAFVLSESLASISPQNHRIRVKKSSNVYQLFLFFII